MAKRWNRMEVWLGLAVIAIGVPIAGIVGLHTYVTATATPLHPDAARVPSVMRTPPPDQWRDAAARGREIMKAGLVARNLPGLSVAVGAGGELVWAEGFGWTDLDSHATVTPETQFRIGSASILLTSAAVGLLVEKHRLKLDEPIQTYVPEFPRKEWPVTLRELMAHTAGLRNGGGDEEPLLGEHCEWTVEGLKAFADLSLLFEPGTEYRYSGYGWIPVSAAIEAVATDPFFTFMQDRLFTPLGLHDTRADVAAQRQPNQATSYFPRYAADPTYGPELLRDVDYSCLAGASAFISTPSDLVRFTLAMARGTLLQPATVQLLQSDQQLPSGKGTGYGLGWDRETVTLQGKPTLALGHDGDILGGQVASIVTFPEYGGLAVAVISNSSYAETAALAQQVAEVFAAQIARR